MDKLIKTEVISLYVSQAVALLAAAYCAWIPSRVETVLIYGRAAIAGNILLAVVIIANIWFVGKRFFQNLVRAPWEIVRARMPDLFLLACDKCHEGKISEADFIELEEKTNKIWDWTEILNSIAYPFFFIDLTAMLEVTGFAFMKSVTENRVCFSSAHGFAAFFVFAQTIWLHIAVTHIVNSIKSWFDRKHAWLDAHHFALTV